ncbi:MAG: dehydrogenase [Prevotella sp.]|nr:dehydrogenase [Prevotella sp.]
MADNFLEKHYAEYERRKEEWLRKKKHLTVTKKIELKK